MVEFPDLRDFGLVHCTVCTLLEDDLSIDEMYLRIGSGDKTQFVLVTSHPQGARYLHVEMAVPEWFEDIPPRKGQRRIFDQVVDSRKGKPCEFRISGTLRVPFSSLPESGIIANGSKTTSSGRAAMRLVGGELKITGTPFHRMKWSFVDEEDDDGVVDITLRGRLKGIMSSGYLEDALAFLHNGFVTFVTGQKNE